MSDAPNVRNVKSDKADKAPDMTHGASGQAHSSGASRRVVWKFPVPMPGATGRAFIDLSASAELLSVGLQGVQMVVWALVDPDYEPEPGYAAEGPRRLIVVNTGDDVPGFPEGAKFLGTVTHPSGVVWHVWDGDAETTA